MKTIIENAENAKKLLTNNALPLGKRLKPILESLDTIIAEAKEWAKDLSEETIETEEVDGMSNVDHLRSI